MFQNGLDLTMKTGSTNSPRAYFREGLFLEGYFSAPSCDCFGRHGEWKKIMATKIIKKVAKLASVLPVK